MWYIRLKKKSNLLSDVDFKKIENKKKERKKERKQKFFLPIALQIFSVSSFLSNDFNISRESQVSLKIDNYGNDIFLICIDDKCKFEGYELAYSC